MSASSGSAKLKRVMKDLKVSWEETLLYWHDENSRQFNEMFMVALLAALRSAELGMDRLSAALNQLRRDCS
ncbi:MAG: hypothetical protein GXY44_04970 [Phycisphaerales bacterium]|nr:hypothetical protein [Phycisphaerales bacterium]